jgi:hypothetical protein
MIRRLPALLLSVLMAAMMGVMVQTALAQTTTLYIVPIGIYGGSEYGNASDIECTTGPGIQCSLTLNHWLYQRNGGMEDVTGTIPAHIYTGTNTGHNVYGLYADYVMSGTAGAMTYFADTDWLEFGGGQQSGRVCLEICRAALRPDTRRNLCRYWVYHVCFRRWRKRPIVACQN